MRSAHGSLGVPRGQGDRRRLCHQDRPGGPVDGLRGPSVHPKVELRWVEAGYAVLLAEDENLLAGSSWERLEPIRAVDTMDTRYLVWGTLKDADVGWATLASARIGTLAVPLPTAVPLSVVSRGRIRLVTREYVVVDREHGNAHVAEERLLGFELYDLEGAI